TLDGKSVKGTTASPVKVVAYWGGMPVIARDWVSLSDFEISFFVFPPDSNKSSCSTAGGCRGKQDWSVWNFESKGGNVRTGMLTGGYTNSGRAISQDSSVPYGSSSDYIVSRVGGGNDYRSDRFEIEISPYFTVNEINFTATSKGEIGLKFINGHLGTMNLDKQEINYINSNGYLIWSKYGEHQVRCLMKVKNLEKIKLVNSERYSNLKGLMKDISYPESFWSIREKDGNEYTVASLSGHQNQPVPKEPPSGKVWLGRPPLETGIVRGYFFVSPNDAGYCLIPLGIISRILPGKRSIVLNTKAGGATLPFSRFHPGDSWISNGVTGGEYIDNDIDTKVKLSDMWLSYEYKGNTKTIKLDKVEA
ncbi:MAG: hypothetical protein GY786_22205, partial [Proteobacteria bacterium]|nr:hypothetical protein [Pseudomonadota bacterium]